MAQKDQGPEEIQAYDLSSEQEEISERRRRKRASLSSKEAIDRMNRSVAQREEKYKKLSNEDVEAMWDRRASRMRENIESGVTGKRVRTGLGVAMLVGAGAFFGFSTIISDNEQSAAAQHESAAESLRAEIASIDPAAAEEETETGAVDEAAVEESLRENIEAAEQVAEEVAVEQNRFAALYEAAEDEEPEGVGLPTESEYEAAEHRRVFEEHFEASTFLVEDSLVDLPSQAPPFGEGSIDPRWPWHLQQGSAAEDYGWELVSVVPQLGEPERIEVVWASYDDEGRLLAWAESVYDSSSSLFGSLSVTTTTLGSDDGESFEAPAFPEQSSSDDDEEQSGSTTAGGEL